MSGIGTPGAASVFSPPATSRRRWSPSPETRRALRKFRQSPLSLVGLGIVVVLVLVAVIGPFLVPFPEDAEGAVGRTYAQLPSGSRPEVKILWEIRSISTIPGLITSGIRMTSKS